MSGVESWVIGYLVNSLWMVPLVFAAAWAAAGVVRSAGARAEHRVWVAALWMEALLPGLQVRPADVWHIMLAFWRWGTKAGDGDVRITVAAAAVQAHGGLQLPHNLLSAIVMAYACSVLYFAARLAWGLWKTYAIECEAVPAELEGTIAARWEWHKRSAGVRDAVVSLSAKTRGPATLGMWCGVLVVPRGFFEGMEENEVDVVMAHECAHMRRRDFGKNVLYSVMALSVAYHPLLWLTFARLTESREMVCDAIAAEAVRGRESYARSLLRLASLFVESEPARTFHAIGIFDANSLERRVMSLMRRKQTAGWALGGAMLAACVAIGAATCASALALRMDVSAEKNEKANEKTTDRTVKVASGVIAGNAIEQKKPVYPAEAKENHIEGAVVMKAIISKEGTVKELQILSGPKELRAASLDAVREWKYRPYVLNGDPTEVETTITVSYNIGN
jgi:TonB family protein